MKSSPIYQFLLKHSVLVILFAAGFLFFANNWNLPIYILDEAKNAECAREMWEKSDYIVPTFNYEMRTDKPPLHYFFMSIAYTLFGRTAFGAHFFSAIMGILTLWITFFYTRKQLGESVALFTAFSLLASIHFLFQFHLAVPDPYLIFSITLSIFSFHFYIEKTQKKHLWLGYVFAALGVLAKGPVALGLIGLTMLLYLLSTRKLNLEELKALRIPIGGLLFLVIALPWYIAVGNATEGVWLEDFFFKHNFNRFGDTMEGHGGGFWITFLFVFLGLFPFALFLPQSLHLAWQKREQSFLKLCLIAAGVIVGFFAISSTKLPNYTVPAYPFLAVLIGHFIHNNLDEKKQSINWSVLLGLLLAIGLFVGTYLGLEAYPLLSDLKYICWVFLACVLGFVFALFSKKYWVLYIGVGTIVTTLLLFYVALPSIMQRNPVQQSAVLLDQKEIFIYKRFNPAYSFQLQKSLKVLETPQEVKARLQDNPDAIFITFTKYGEELESLKLDTIFLQQDLFEGTKTLILQKTKK